MRSQVKHADCCLPASASLHVRSARSHSRARLHDENARADGRPNLHVENAHTDGRPSLHVENARADGRPSLQDRSARADSQASLHVESPQAPPICISGLRPGVVSSVLGVCVFKCRSPAIRGRRFVTRQMLSFSGASARPTWERSLEGFLELEGHLRGNMPQNMRKFRKIVPRPFKIEPWGLQTRACSPPRHHFKRIFKLRTLLGSTIPSFLRPKWPTWLHLGGTRPSQIEAKTSQNRC